MGRHHDDDDNNSNWKGYFKCDEMIPPLCDDDLTVTVGRVETLKGLNVTYWRYTPSSILEQQSQRHRHDHPRGSSSSLAETKTSSNHQKFPIIVINGGPGLPHDFVKPTRNLACDGREIVMYDQAGTGASQWDQQDNSNGDDDGDASLKYPQLLTLEYYTQVELPALLRALQWDKYHILAESWGTQIAFAFATTSSKSNNNIDINQGLQSLLLNAPIADNHKFIEYQWDPNYGSIGKMPTYLQMQLLHFNATQDFDNPEFEQLQEMVESEFNARLGVAVDCWLDTEAAGIASIDYDPLSGPTDMFYPPPGTALRGWSVLDQLRQLSDRVPVQLNYGGYDMVSPLLIADTAAAIGGSAVECHEVAQSAHAILLDAPETVYPYMRDFLQRVEEFVQDNNIRRGQAPFKSNGSCPVLRDGILYYENNQSDIPANKMHHWIVVGNRTILLALVFAVTSAVSYWVGIKVGSRRNKKYTGRYEQVIDLPEHHI